MRNFTKFFISAFFLLLAFVATAQNSDSTKTTKKVEKTKAAEKPKVEKQKEEKTKSAEKEKTKAPKTKSSTKDSTATAGKSSVKDSTVVVTKPAREEKVKGTDTSGKDVQNQLKFMHPDMDSRKYNFYERRSVSTPLMPRYDLDSAVYQSGKKRRKQQEAYKNNQYFFPAKPKDAWELGINFGGAFVSGNVRAKISPFNPLDNVGVGIGIRKSFGYTFSMRLQYTFMQSTGRDWQPNYNLKFNQVLNPDGGGGTPNEVPKHRTSTGPNYYNNPRLDATSTERGMNTNGFFWYNYRTHIHDLSLQAIANLGNINFHRERNIMNIYLLAGVDAYIFQTKYDALDAAGNVYDFSPELAVFQNQGNNTGGVNYLVKDKKKQILRMLNQKLDGKYETLAEQDQNVPGFKHWQFVPSFSLGAGIAFHVTKFMTIGLEERVILSQRSTLLDGYRWQQDEHTALTSHNDNISYTSVNFNFHLLGKKRTEPLYWLNPIHYSYRKIGEINPQANAEELFKDDDNDGIPNILDREPNTKKGCPVDSHGVILDSDRDGIPDCEDKEPFSPPAYPVDSNGVAIVPPNPCCDTTRYYREPESVVPETPVVVPVVPVPGAPAVIDTITGLPTKPPVIAPVVPKKTITDCSKIDLPFIVFDGETYFVDPQYYGNLHQIAERMQLCPEIKIVVTGYGAARNEQKFNEQLGWNRANAAVDYLVEKYGISRDRFILKYVGQKTAATGTPYEKRMKNKSEFRYSNEGETGESNPPAPHPGIKAGSNK